MYIVPLVAVLMVLRHVHQEKRVYPWELWKSISYVMPFYNALEGVDLHIFPFIKLIIHKIFWLWNSLTQLLFPFFKICSEYLPLNLSFSLKVLSVYLKSWVNLLYSAELSPVYSITGISSSSPEMQNPLWQERKAVLWLKLGPKGQALSKYDFIQLVRPRVALKKPKQLTTKRLVLGRQVSSVFNLCSSWLGIILCT